MSITSANIVTEYGNYYVDAGQNKKRLLSLLTQGRELQSFVTPIKTNDTIFRLGNAAFSKLVQPFQKTFTQKGGVTITPNEIRVFNMKIDDEFYPDEIKANWLGFLAGKQVSRKEWPLVKWLMEDYYKQQIDRDMELDEYYNGVYAAPTPGTPGASGSSMDGLKKLLQAGVDDDSMNVVPLGALAVDSIFDQVELFTDGISEVYQGVEMKVCMSRYWYKKYMQDKRVQGWYTKNSDKDIDAGIDFTPQSVVPMAMMTGTEDIFCTPKANLLHITPETDNKSNFKVEESKRVVSVMGDWNEGLGFGLNGAVWTNKIKTV
jgi:hypothetical protein